MRSFLVALCIALSLPLSAAVNARAQTGTGGKNREIAQALSSQDVYVDPVEIRAGHARKGDDRQLEQLVQAASRQGVPVKVGVISQYPGKHSTPQEAADKLRVYLDFSGVLVLVTPHGPGVSSDLLSAADVRSVKRSAHCGADYTRCSADAVNAAVPLVKAEQARENRNVAVFWAVAIAAFGVVIVVLVFAVRRRQQQIIAGWANRSESAAEK